MSWFEGFRARKAKGETRLTAERPRSGLRRPLGKCSLDWRAKVAVTCRLRCSYCLWAADSHWTLLEQWSLKVRIRSRDGTVSRFFPSASTW